MVGNKCKIQVEVGRVGDESFMQWVDGVIIQVLPKPDHRIVVRVPKCDQLYFCESEEVFISIKNVTDSLTENLNQFLRPPRKV